MRVLLVTPDFPPERGGVQNLLEKLASGLAERHETGVVTLEAPGDRAWDRTRGYRVRRARRMPTRLLSLASLALLVLTRAALWRPDLIVCGHILLGPLCRVATRLFGIPYVAIAHGSEIRSALMAGVAGTGLRGAARCVTGSEFTRVAILAHGVPAERVVLIRPGPGADTDPGPAPPPRDAGGRILLSVSRLVERYKGHDMVIRALPLIRAKVPEAEYVIVGHGWLTPFLERLASSLGVRDAVSFVGEVSDAELDAWYRRCDVFVLASRESAVGGGSEGYGLVFIEANLRGKPVIGGRSGGVPDAVIDGVTGLLVNPSNVGEIVDAAVLLLSDAALAARLGSQGRRHAVEDLSWPRYLERFDELLRAVVPT